MRNSQQAQYLHGKRHAIEPLLRAPLEIANRSTVLVAVGIEMFERVHVPASLGRFDNGRKGKDRDYLMRKRLATVAVGTVGISARRIFLALWGSRRNVVAHNTMATVHEQALQLLARERGWQFSESRALANAAERLDFGTAAFVPECRSIQRARNLVLLHRH